MIGEHSLQGVSRSWWSVIAWGWLVLVAWGVSGGCQWAYFMTDPDKEKQVKAEYGKIGSRKVAVVVWADQATVDTHPRTQLRVCKGVTYYLRKYLPDATFVDAEEVWNLQDGAGDDWENMTAQQLCERLSCALILRVDLLEYTTRAGDARELRKARIRASINLFECGEKASADAVYDTELVVTYPPDRMHGISEMDDDDLLHEAIESFSQEVARKFYDHGMSMRGPEDR